jgi:hypothetical protein
MVALRIHTLSSFRSECTRYQNYSERKAVNQLFAKLNFLINRFRCPYLYEYMNF